APAIATPCRNRSSPTPSEATCAACAAPSRPARSWSGGSTHPSGSFGCRPRRSHTRFARPALILVLSWLPRAFGWVLHELPSLGDVTCTDRPVINRDDRQIIQGQRRFNRIQHLRVR